MFNKYFYSILLLHLLLLLNSCSSQEWNDLRARFGLNPITNFVQMPRTAVAAIRQGFVAETSCSGSGNGFVGERFVHSNGDRSLMLLFDIRGIIAGVQTEVPKSTGYPTAAHKQANDVWIEEKDAHVLTAYFVDPKIICTTGRTYTQFDKDGTGTALYLQYGKSASNTVIRAERIANNEADLGGKFWTKGKCFAFMGQHYWYNLRQSMNCNEFLPFFALYNDGRLDGFGFAMAANFKGEFFEHPNVSLLNNFLPFTPSCMKESGFPNTLSTVHVYFYQRPWTKLCL